MDAIALGCVGWGYRDVEIRIRQLLDQQLLGRRRRGHRGTLVLGAIARTLRHPSPVNAVILGVGVAILANSRPYEGLLFCLSGQGKSGHAWSLQNRPYGMARDVVLIYPAFS